MPLRREHVTHRRSHADATDLNRARKGARPSRYRFALKVGNR